MEVLVLAPLLAACVIGFALAAQQLVAMASAEAALARALEADAIGGSLGGAIDGRARVVERTALRLTIEVPASLGAVRVSGRRLR